MGINISALIFTPADIADDSDGGANVGAYVRAGTDGELIDSTGGALHVVQQGDVNVTATNLDIRDLVFATDKVDVSGSVITTSITGTYAEDTVSADAETLFMAGAQRRDANTSSVSADGDRANLLVNAIGALKSSIMSAAGVNMAIDGSGFLTVNQGGTWNVNLTDDSVADDAADTGNPFKVGGIARATSAALDLADAADRVDMTFNLARHQLVADMATQAIKQQVVTVGNTAGVLVASPLANRKKILIQNDGAREIYIGTTTVTADAAATGGTKIPKGDSYEVPISDGVPVYAIATASTAGIRVLELA